MLYEVLVIKETEKKIVVMEVEQLHEEKLKLNQLKKIQEGHDRNV